MWFCGEGLGGPGSYGRDEEVGRNAPRRMSAIASELELGR